MRSYSLLKLMGSVIAGVLTVGCATANVTEHQTDVGAVLAATEVLERAEFHHQYEVLAVSNTPAINPAWLGRVSNARTAVAVVDWPHNVQKHAHAFLEASEGYVAALNADDLEAAIVTVSSTHHAFHALTGAAYIALAEEVGLKAAEGHTDHEND